MNRSLIVSLLFVSAAATSAPPPCDRIAKLCAKAGFGDGPLDKSDGQVQACVRAVLAGKTGGLAHPLPEVPKKALSECKKAGPPTDPAVLEARLQQPLRPGDGGKTVYDPVLDITWLADGNLAATETFGVRGIGANGVMTYGKAQEWVAAMNAANGGKGYLGRTDWRLPTTPPRDETCDRKHRNTFGFGCTGSDFGALYTRGLGLRWPATAVAVPPYERGQFRNLQPYLYWSETSNANHEENVNGFTTFSFANGFQGANVSDNHLYVLPMIPGRAVAAAGARGDAKRFALATVYDPIADVTWLANGNLAATETFGVTGIAPSGAMTREKALEWIAAMNTSEGGAGYLGRKDWQLPPSNTTDPSCSKKNFAFGCTGSPMGALYYNVLKLEDGEPVVRAPDTAVGPLRNVEPYLYWSCQRDPADRRRCGDEPPAKGFQWSFSFGNGFQGTTTIANKLYVMVYHPGPPAAR